MAGAAPGRPPDGYRECAIGGTLVVTRDDCHAAVIEAVRSAGTLHRWAAAQPGARGLHGRGVAWATALPGGPAVVVRHSRHGGALAAVTRDLFLAPTRAPRELDVSLRLKAAGVRTPTVLAYAVYSAVGPFCRADVMTAWVDGVELPAALREHQSHQDRHDIRVAVSRLLEALWQAGATHPDLNAKNVLVLKPFSGHLACVLDVDRVKFGRPRDTRMGPMFRNSTRLRRSLTKLRAEHGLPFMSNELGALTSFRQPGARVTIVPPGA